MSKQIHAPDDDEKIQDEAWKEYIENFRDGRRGHKQDSEFTTLSKFEQAVKQLTKGPKQNPDQGPHNLKAKQLLSRMRRDLPILFADEYELTLQCATILILEIMDDIPYFFQDNLQHMLEMLTCLTLKDYSQLLLINSTSLKEFIKKQVKEIYLESTQYNPICEILFLLIVMMIAHQDFIKNPDLELVQLIDQRDKTVRERETLEQRKKFEKKITRKQAAEQEELPPEEKYLQVPTETQKILIYGLTLIPSNICQMPSSYKYQQSEEIMKETAPNIFLNTLSFKMKQTLIQTIKENKREYDVVTMLIDLAGMPEAFTQQREALRTVNMFLEGFDDTLLWIKFDSPNLFDNSNLNNVLIYGDPTKLTMDQGLFYDGCGCFFDRDQVLQLEEPLRIDLKVISISFWMVMFNPETSKTRGAQNNYQIRSLLGSSDGFSSLVICDAFSQMLGITNISTEKDHQTYGYKFFEPKNTEKNLSGWNHIVVILDNEAAAAYLYMNGQYESQIAKVLSNFDVQFIGNSASLDQPIGYVCDLRIYPKVLNDSEIKHLSYYDKKQVVLQPNDIVDQILSSRQIMDLKRLLQSFSHKNSEALIQVLQVLSRLCQATTIFRLECAKYGIFDLAMQLLPSPNQQVSYHAIQSYNFPLKYDVVLVAAGKLLGESITLIGYTTIGSVLLFHNNTSSFLNIKREFKSLDVSQQCLVMASENTLTVHDVDNNFDQCYKELPDGINTLTVGPYFDGYTIHDLIFVGGNCSIQGFNNQGDEIYWNVASDEVVCLNVFGQDKEYYIAVGTADNCIRLLRGEEIVFQYNTQSLPVCFSGLIYFDQAHLVTALENGQLALFRASIQEWKNSEEEEKIFKIICCDENHLVVGRKNGMIELRQLLSGSLLQKISVDETITGMVYTDLRGVRVNQIVVVTRSGNVRGITIVDKEENTKSLSDQLAELQQKKQELTQQLTMDTLPVGLRVSYGYTKNASNQCIDLVFQMKEQGYYITQAIIFHDTYFKDGYVVTTPQPTDQLFAPLKQLVDNQKLELNCKVFVTSNPYGNFFQVLDAKPTFKRFSNFYFTDQEQQINSFVEGKIKERVPRYVKWIDQCFIVHESAIKQFESQSEFIFNAVNVINKLKLQIHFNSNEGKVIVKCDSIAVCGDIIQDLCDFIQIQELMTVGQFPIEMSEFKQVLERVQQHKASKLQISGDVAEAMNQVKSLVVKAEDSRMIGDIATMQKMYANVMVQNRAIQSEIYKKQQNNEILMSSLKEVNSMINKASQLRVGNAKATITTMCRNAVKKNNLLSLIEVIQSGREI